MIGSDCFVVSCALVGRHTQHIKLHMSTSSHSSPSTSPLPPPRNVPHSIPLVDAEKDDAAHGGCTAEEHDSMCAQLASLILQKEEDRVEKKRLHDLLDTYQRRRAEGSDPTTSTLVNTTTIGGGSNIHIAQRRPLERVSSAAARRSQKVMGEGSMLMLEGSSSPVETSSPVTTLTVHGSGGAVVDDLLVSQLQLQRLERQNEVLASTTMDLQATCDELQGAYEVKLKAAQEVVEDRDARIAELLKERDALRERVATEVLLQSQRNRIEMATRRIAAPKRTRTAGLQRIEGCERNAMAAHDDMYYIRRDLAMQAPTHRVTLVLQMFRGTEELKAMAPQMLPYVMSTYYAVLASQAAKRDGFRVAEWAAFTCYAFRSPTAALNFASACHIELMNHCWPDTIVYCRPFAVEKVPPAEASPAPPSIPSSGGRRLGGDEDSKMVKIYQGPRLHSYLHFGNPSTEIDPKTGRLAYFGHGVHVAVSTLAYLVRAGEICANAEWGEAVMVEAGLLPQPYTQPLPSTAVAATTSRPESVGPTTVGRNVHSAQGLGQSVRMDSPAQPLSPPPPPAPSSLYRCDDAAEYMKAHGYPVCDVRRGFPRISVLLQTDLPQRGAFSRSSPVAPKWLLVPELFSILPEPLALRKRHTEPTWAASCLAATEKAMSFVLLANRCMNGRICNANSITEEIRGWISKAVRESIAYAASHPMITPGTGGGGGGSNHHGGGAAGVAASTSSHVSMHHMNTQQGSPVAHPIPVPASSTTAGPAASPQRHRRSFQSDAGVTAGQRTRGPSTTNPQDPLESTDNGGKRGLIRRGSKSTANDTSTGSLNTTTSTLNQPTTTAVQPPPQHLPPMITIPFPPLTDDAPLASAVAPHVQAASKARFAAYVFQRQSQAFELAAMEREDALRCAKHKPLSSLNPATTFVTVDVVNLRSDGNEEEDIVQVIAPFRKCLELAADVHHGFLVAQHEEVHLFAFRDVSDALKFTAAVHIRFREDGLSESISSPALRSTATNSFDGVLAQKGLLMPNVVGARCGVSYGIPATCTSMLAPHLLPEQREDVRMRDVMRTVCSGSVVRLSGYLCAAAAPHETLVTQSVVRQFHTASKKNVSSLELTIVFKGLRVVEGLAPCALYSVQASSLVRAALPQKQGSATAGAVSTTAAGGARTASIAPRSQSLFGSFAGGGNRERDHSVSGGAAWFTNLQTPVLVGGVQFDPQTVSNVVFQAQTAAARAPSVLIESMPMQELDKILRVVDAKQHEALQLLTTHPAHQRLMRRSLAAMHRMQIAERSLMQMHDPLCDDARDTIPPLPTESNEFAVLYTDIESSSKTVRGNL